MQNKIESVVESGRIPVFLSSEKVLANLEPKQEKVVKPENDRGTSVLTPTGEMVNHGFGVLEDHKGDVWYKGDDGFIYKNATTAEDRAVQRFMNKKV